MIGEEAHLDTTTANGRSVFGIFAALAEFEREPIPSIGSADRCFADGSQER